VVETKDFPRNGWEHHLHVTADTIWLASSGVEGNDWTEYSTRLQAIDISDPAGRIAVRGSGKVRGRVPDRWALDEYQGILRVASTQWWGNGDVYLTTLGVEDLDDIVVLAERVLQVQESLTAARFDGPRGYLVTYRNIDPLFAFDLSDPARPKLLGELKMTGWLDFMAPLGDRLVALGHEDVTVGDQRKISLAVSLVDVSKDEAPALLSRVVLDGSWGWVPGSRDDFAKVFKTIPELGLILFPFQTYDTTTWRTIGGVQLIDLARDALTKRGLIADSTWVERGISYDPATVLTLSAESFQAVDIADRDAPRVRSKLELARNVQGFALLPGDFTVQLSGGWESDARLCTTPIADPDTSEPLASVTVPTPYGGRLFPNGSLAYIVGTVQIPAQGDVTASQTTRIWIYDLSDPTSPVQRGTLDLPEAVGVGYPWYWGWGDEAVQVNGSLLAFPRYAWRWWWVDVALADAAVGAALDEPVEKIYLADLADPDHPVLASTVEIPGISWAWGLKTVGSTLYLSSYVTENLGDAWYQKYYLHRIDASVPASPVLRDPVNIPGMFVDAAPGGEIVYTDEGWWDSDGQAYRNLLHALRLGDKEATLLSSVELPGYTNGIAVKDGAAFAITNLWSPVVLEGVVATWVSKTDLVAVDLSDPAAIKIAGNADLSTLDSLYLVKVEGGRAFLGSWAGLVVYDVSDLASPTFEEFFRTQGYPQDLVLRDRTLFVPSGYYGVQVLTLGQ
jgi:hypothetical protein